jgi:uncharacterized membrane protein
MKYLAFVLGALMAITSVFADTVSPGVKAHFAELASTPAAGGIPVWVLLLALVGIYWYTTYWYIKKRKK